MKSFEKLDGKIPPKALRTLANYINGDDISFYFNLETLVVFL